jgi:hypothetical protein
MWSKLAGPTCPRGPAPSCSRAPVPQPPATPQAPAQSALCALRPARCGPSLEAQTTDATRPRAATSGHMDCWGGPVGRARPVGMAHKAVQGQGQGRSKSEASRQAAVQGGLNLVNLGLSWVLPASEDSAQLRAQLYQRFPGFLVFPSGPYLGLTSGGGVRTLVNCVGCPALQVPVPPPPPLKWGSRPAT